MKQPSPASIERVKKMTFAYVYPALVSKVEKKGRTEKELHQVIEWFTGYNNKKIKTLLKNEVTYEDFIDKAQINPNAHLITGVICGYRVEEIEDPFMQKCRYLDKIIDELAKGKKMEKILRTE